MWMTKPCLLISCFIMSTYKMDTVQSQTYCQSTTGTNSTRDITIAALFPITGWWPGGDALRIATEMAIEDVNERPDILAGYTLRMEWNDTEVNYLIYYF